MGEIICTTTEHGGKSIIYDLQIQNQNVKLDTKSIVYIYIYALRHSVSLDNYVSGDQEKKRKIE